MVPRINIEEIKEETWNNLERKSISHGEAVPVQARYQESRAFLHPSSQTESRPPEEQRGDEGRQRWTEAGGVVPFCGPRARRGSCNYLLLAAEKNPSSTQKPDETPYNASQNLILLVLTAAALRIHLRFLNCEGARLSCPLTPKAGPLSRVRTGTRPLGGIYQRCGPLCNVMINVWTSSG